MVFKINCETYLRNYLGEFGFESITNMFFAESSSKEINEINDALKNSAIVRRERNILYLRFFEDIFVTSAEDSCKLSKIVVNFGGDFYDLSQILEKDIYLTIRQ